MKIFPLILLIAVIACSKSKKTVSHNDFLSGKKLGELTDRRLSEVSGLAMSAVNEGYLWAQNDNGNSAQVFLIDKKSNIKMTCKLEGLENRDWEDIAVGPGPVEGKSYIYVADIGDNDAKYRFKRIYRFEEPRALQEEEIVITEFDTIIFKLSDHKKDTEALMIDPLTKDLYVVSKREQPVYVYKLTYPFSTHDTLIAEAVAKIPLTQITAGGISADGTEILLKNYDDIYYWKNDSSQSIADALKLEPKILPYEPELQGEAITWASDGSGFYTLSESGFLNKATKGEKIYLLFYPRK